MSPACWAPALVWLPECVLTADTSEQHRVPISFPGAARVGGAGVLNGGVDSIVCGRPTPTQCLILSALRPRHYQGLRSTSLKSVASVDLTELAARGARGEAEEWPWEWMQDSPTGLRVSRRHRSHREARGLAERGDL